MPTIEMTAEVVKALLEGISRLNDGADREHAVVKALEKQLFAMGLFATGTGIYPVGNACSGWTMRGYAWMDYNGVWQFGTEPVPPGTALYLDVDCTMFLRHTS